LLVGGGFASEVAHPPGFIAKQGICFFPHGLLRRGKARFMIRQVQPAVVAVQLAALAHLLDQQQNQGLVLHRQRHTTQAFPSRARFILMLLMVGRQHLQNFTLPARRDSGV